MDLNVKGKKLVAVLDGIINQLDYNDSKELLSDILSLLTSANKQTLLEHCLTMYPTSTKISLLENGVIEED